MAETKGLSKTMREVFATVAANGGEIHRYPGGFWCVPSDRSRTFGTTTIQALVSRGYLSYSKWHEGATRFPIAAALVISESK